MNQVKPLINSRENSVINNCSMSNDVDNLSVSFLTPINLLTSSNQSTQIVFTETTASISSSRVSHLQQHQHVSHNNNATLNLNDIVVSSNNVIVQPNDISVGNGSGVVVEHEHSPVLMISEQKDATSSTSEGNILHIITTDSDQKSVQDETDGKFLFLVLNKKEIIFCHL